MCTVLQHGLLGIGQRDWCDWLFDKLVLKSWSHVSLLCLRLVKNGVLYSDVLFAGCIFSHKSCICDLASLNPVAASTTHEASLTHAFRGDGTLSQILGRFSLLIRCRRIKLGLIRLHVKFDWVHLEA